jgi:ornithine cyclodeaminase/alanine dehydrogenase-like protein (mu-crystallin family)
MEPSIDPPPLLRDQPRPAPARAPQSWPPRVLSVEDVLSFGYPDAVDALQEALRHGVDTASDPPRTALPLGQGAVLYSMPSVADGAVGIKLVTNSEHNSQLNVPATHGIYVQFDPETLAPVTVMDGAALTTLRTPAVSVTAVRPALRRFAQPLDVVIFGVGPQGIGHLDALIDVAARDGDFPAPGSVTFVSRRAARDRIPHRAGVDISAVAVGDHRVTRALEDAHVVICATGSPTPLFDSSLLTPQAVVVAVGTHDPHEQEVDAALCARATVIVEDMDMGLRSCGEVVKAVNDGTLGPERLLAMSDLFTTSQPLSTEAPVLFTGGGMGWQDRIVAEAVIRHTLDTPAPGE